MSAPGLRPGERIGYLGLGTNVGDRRAQLQAAIDALPAHGVRILASSATYDTDPVGDVLDQPDFLNACVRIATELGPEELLDACKAVEREQGRTTDVTSPEYVRHGPRPIDVDLLLLGDEAYASERLTLPHAQVTERRFVLVPLLELDLGLELPDGTSLARRLEQLPLDEGVRRSGDPLPVPTEV
jgi:2-amino-4-hydroxy-6-hydroxymethyldihydropteridine diphosphokinase